MTAVARRFTSPIGAATVVVVVLLAVTLIVASTPVGARWNGDLQLFHHYAGTFLNGYVSETSYLSWYPPLSLLPITLPRLIAPELSQYSFLFALEMSLAAGVLVLITAHLTTHWPSTGLPPVPVVVVLLLLTAVYLPWRFDALPALATAGAVAAAITGPGWLAGAMLGAGTALKLYPAALLPVLAAWFWFRDQHRPMTEMLVAFAVATGLGFAVYWLFPPASLGDLIVFQGGRGLQIESVLGSVIDLLAVLGLVAQPQVQFRDGSFNLVGSTAATALQLSTGLELALLALALIAAGIAFRRRGLASLAATDLAVGLTAALLALLLGNRVLSPQYMIWLIPVVALIPRRGALMGGAAVLLTGVLFPFLYDQLLQLAPVPVALLVARNLLLAGLYVSCLLWLVRPHRAGRLG